MTSGDDMTSPVYAGGERFGIQVPTYVQDRDCTIYGKKCILVRCCADIRDRPEICVHDKKQVEQREQQKKERKWYTDNHEERMKRKKSSKIISDLTESLKFIKN